MRFHIHIPRVALLVVVWNRRLHWVLLNAWGYTPLHYRKEMTTTTQEVTQQ